MNQPKVEIKDVEKIFDLVRHSSEGSLSNLLGLTESDVSSANLSSGSDLSYDHWVCCIVVAFKEMSISFTIHFMSKTARGLASLGMSKSADQLSPKSCHDFIREYSNVTAGKIKSALQGCDFSVENLRDMMLPLQEPSYDMGTIQEQTEGHWLHHWLLDVKDIGEVICSAKVEVTDTGFVDKLQNLDQTTVTIDDEGDIDFF